MVVDFTIGVVKEGLDDALNSAVKQLQEGKIVPIGSVNKYVDKIRDSGALSRLVPKESIMYAINLITKKKDTETDEAALERYIIDKAVVPLRERLSTAFDRLSSSSAAKPVTAVTSSADLETNLQDAKSRVCAEIRYTLEQLSERLQTEEIKIRHVSVYTARIAEKLKVPQAYVERMMNSVTKRSMSETAEEAFRRYVIHAAMHTARDDASQLMHMPTKLPKLTRANAVTPTRG